MGFGSGVGWFGRAMRWWGWGSQGGRTTMLSPSSSLCPVLGGVGAECGDGSLWGGRHLGRGCSSVNGQRARGAAPVSCARAGVSGVGGVGGLLGGLPLCWVFPPPLSLLSSLLSLSSPLLSCPPSLSESSPLHATDRTVGCCCCMGQQRVVGWDQRWCGRDVAVWTTCGRPSSRPVVGMVVVVGGGGRW
jgi:hypothetical protein